MIAVAHGSRDPRSAETVRSIVEALRGSHPGIEVHVAFLGLSLPSLADVAGTVARAGHDRAVVVPLLLGSAFHSRVDLPALIAEASARHPGLELLTAPVLGDDPRLVTAVRDRIAAVGCADGGCADSRRASGGGAEGTDVAVALAAVGSSSAPANALTRSLAARVHRDTAYGPTRVCFAAAAEPSVDAAVAGLARAGARRIVVGLWFLAPGLLTDRVRAQAVQAAARAGASAVVAEPIGAHALVPQVIADRYRYAVRTADDTGCAAGSANRAA